MSNTLSTEIFLCYEEFKHGFSLVNGCHCCSTVCQIQYISASTEKGQLC